MSEIISSAQTIFTENTEKQAKNHIISVEDFKMPPQSISSYTPPNIFTRENFASGIAFSFAVSRGDPRVQMAFFEWKKRNQEEDIPTTLIHFREAGGINCLTKEEQALWTAPYRRVKEHARLLPKEEDVYTEEVDKDILYKIAADISNHESYPNMFGTTPFLPEAELKGMSWQEFKNNVNQHFANKQQK